jgi:LysM repeat protein
MSENAHTETVVAETPRPTEAQPDESHREETAHTRGELIKFGILTLVLLGTVLVVAVTRPLIFGHIVPAIMGEGAAPEVVEPLPPAESMPGDDTAVDQIDDTDPVSAEEPATTEPYPAPTTSQETFIPAVGSSDEAYPVPEDEDSGEETAVISHTVQPNDNLTKIAEQYGVTVQEIIALNNITNPNRIEAGTILQIPVQRE